MKIQTYLLIISFCFVIAFQNCAQKESIHLESVTAASTDSTNEGTTDNNPNDGGTTILPPLVNYKSCMVDGVERPHLWSEWGLKNLSPAGSNSTNGICDLFELRQCLDGNINNFSVGNPNISGCVTSPFADNISSAPCNIDNLSIPHGHVAILFKNVQTTGNQNCLGQIRRCNNGTLSGDSNFSSLTCGESFYTPASGKSYSCELNGIQIPDGSAIVSFSEEIATVTPTNPSGVCEFESRRCIQGRLSGARNKSTCRPIDH